MAFPLATGLRSCILHPAICAEPYYDKKIFVVGLTLVLVAAIISLSIQGRRLEKQADAPLNAP